jgi:hypothetical protein
MFSNTAKMNSFFSTVRSRITDYITDEAEGDTEDDTHICRVLRAYYAEKSRPLPPWLPPDPKAPVVTPAYSNSGPRAGGYGGFNPQHGGGTSLGRVGSGASTGSGGRGVLSDLWDSPKGNHGHEPTQPDSFSMRRQAVRPTALSRPAGGQPGHRHSPSSGEDAYHHSSDEGRRPLPSQRVGSYQSHKNSSRGDEYNQPAQPSPSSLSSWSAQDRLKAKFTGRTASPSPTSFTNYTMDQRSKSGDAGAGPYDRGEPSGSGMYGGSRSGSAPSDGYATSGSLRRERRGPDQPYVGSSAPWSNGDDRYGDGGGGGGSRNGNRDDEYSSGGSRWGLPNGPKQRR